MRKVISSTVLVFSLTTAAHAGLSCSGTVSTIAYHQPGQIMLRLSSMNYPVFICSTDADYAMPGSLAGTTTPAACKALYATLLAAKSNGTFIGEVVFDGDQVPGSCGSFSPWSSVNLRYLSH